MTPNPAGAVLAGRRPERLPVAPVFGADHAAARAGVPLRDAMTDGDRLAGVLLAAHEDYGGDLLVVFSDVTVEAEAMGATVRFSPDLPPHVAEPAGEIRKLDPERDGRLPVILRAAALARAALPPDLPVLVSLKGPFSLAVLALGMDRLLALAIEDPPKARDAVLAAAESQEAYVAAIVRRGGIPLIGDPFASGSVLGPGHFEALALPGLAGLVFAAHRTGSPAAIHICGDLRPVQRLVHRAGADLLHLEQADFAAATAAGSVVLGGVPTDVFLRDEAAVRAAVRAAANTAPPGHRFILGTACDLPTRADPELARAMVDEARRLPWSP